MLPITGIEDELGEGWAGRPCSHVHTEPRMSFTEEPTRIWRGWKRRQPRDGVLLAAAGLCGCPPAIQHGGQGWRAEYSRPSALLDTGQTLLEEAALRYSVPLVSMRGLCALPMEFGDALMAA